MIDTAPDLDTIDGRWPCGCLLSVHVLVEDARECGQSWTCRACSAWNATQATEAVAVRWRCTQCGWSRFQNG